MLAVQKPAVAGSFYPDDPTLLGQAVEGLLARFEDAGTDQPKALIMPHAGYNFSGAVAAAAASRLKPGITRVVILGPSHYNAFKGVALPDADALSTPLGRIPIDESANSLIGDPDVRVNAEAYAKEHSIEVELPFLQVRLGTFSVLPLLVGDIDPARLSGMIDRLWGGPDTLIVISTDLTHFMTAAQASKLDANTASKIETAEPDGLTGREACGVRALGSFLMVASRRGLRITRLALTHSGAVTGDDSRVVGYGAWMAQEPEAICLGQTERAMALTLARSTMVQRTKSTWMPSIRGVFPQPLHGFAACFVTVEMAGELRGCIGSLRANRSLKGDIILNSVKAGFEDPRFPPISAEELAGSHLEIAVLSRPAPISFRTEDEVVEQLRPGRDGIILDAEGQRGTFLPKVWDGLASPEDFWTSLKRKAGVPEDYWSANCRVWRYVAESFSEHEAKA